MWKIQVLNCHQFSSVPFALSFARIGVQILNLLCHRRRGTRDLFQVPARSFKLLPKSFAALCSADFNLQKSQVALSTRFEHEIPQLIINHSDFIFCLISLVVFSSFASMGDAGWRGGALPVIAFLLGLSFHACK